MQHPSIIMHTRNYVRTLLDEKLPKGMYFHNLKHTEDVVMAAYEIGSQSLLTAQEQTIVTVAAWLHDTGYCFEYKGHEEASMAIAGTFLRQEGCDYSFTDKVMECIAATRMPQQPQTLLEQVLCDADMFHLASPFYFDYAARLQQEWATALGQNINDRDWMNGNLDILTGSGYFTTYGKQVLQEGRTRNVQAVKMKLQG